MDFVNGTKLWKVGDADVVYAPDKVRAYNVMLDQIGDEDELQEIIEDYPIEEMAQEEFDQGSIYYDKTGKLDMYDAPNVPMEKALLDMTKDGELSGHFSTTEY